MQVPVRASDINWDISKSKTATQLDENYRCLLYTSDAADE